MNSKITKKVLGVALVIALIVTQALVAIPAQADTPEMKLTQTFETATSIGGDWPSVVGAQTNASSTETPLSLVDETGHGKVLSLVKTNTTANFKTSVTLKNTQGIGLGTVNAGEFYDTIITFDYKVNSANSNGWGMFMQQFYFDDNSYEYWNKGISSNRSVSFKGNNTSALAPDENTSAFKAISDGKWHTISFAVSIKAIITKTNPSLGFVFDIPQGQTCNILFDNFNAEFATGASFCLHPDNGEELDITSGVVGDALTLPIPYKAGYTFRGWYLDSGFQTPVGDTVTANTTSWGTKENAITHLYARWYQYKTMTQNFDAADSVSTNGYASSIGYWAYPNYSYKDANGDTQVPVTLESDGNGGQYVRINVSNKQGYQFKPNILIGDGASHSINDQQNGKSYYTLITFNYKINKASTYGWGSFLEGFFFDDNCTEEWGAKSPSCSGSVSLKTSSTGSDADSNTSAFKTVTDGEWHTMTIGMTIKAIGADYNNFRLGFRVNVPQNDTVDFCLDNFAVSVLGSTTAVASGISNIALHSNGGSNDGIIAGQIGTPMTLPTPTKKNSQFLGWYTDAACTNPVTAAKFPKNTETFGTKADYITNYYAKWSFTGSNYVETFEGYDNTSIANNVTSNSYQNASTGTVNNVVTVESNVDGHSKALRFNKPSSSANDYYPWIVAKASEGLGGVVAGNTYNVILKFDYKTNSVTGNEYGFNIENFAFCNGTVSANDYQSSNKAFQFLKNNTTANTVGLYNEFTAIADNEWHTVGLAMQITAKNTLNDAFLSFKVNTGMRSVIDFYLDNIDISILGDGEVGSTVALVSNGGTEYDCFAGVVGQPLTLPDDIECEDHEFKGWFTDSDLLNEVGENPVFTANTDSWGAKTNAVTKYYAKWYVDDGYKSLNETFEEASTEDIAYSFANDISNMHGTPTIEQESGNKYFKYTYNSNSEKFITPFIVFDENDTDGYSLNQYIRNGSTYKVLIDYKYKIDKSYGEGIWMTPAFIDMDSASIVSTKVGGKFIKLGKSSYAYDDNAALAINDGTWRQASIVVELKATASTFAGFGFNFDAAKNDLTVCLDDISVEVLEPGSGYYNLSVDTTGTSYKIDNTTGQYGEAISLTLPTNMYKKGAKFIGFKDQNGVAYSNSRTFDSEDLTFSAEFEYNKKVYDYNFDESVNIIDIVVLKKLFAYDKDFTETVANPSEMLSELVNTLISIDVTKTLGGNTYTLAWNDEFNGNSLDTGVWNKKSSVGTVYSYDPKNQRVNVACEDANLVSVSDGNLRLGYSRVSANKTVNVYRNANNEYVYDPTDLSGLTLVKANAPVYYANASGVISNASYKYGYIESRMKLPGGNFGASFWLNNTSAKLLNNEVDLFETLNSMDIKSNIHTWDPTNWHGDQINYHRDWYSQGIIGNERIAAEDYDASGYHTFGFEWTPSCVKFYYDGNAYLTLTLDDLAGTDYENDFDGFVNEALRMNIDGTLYANNTNESTTKYLVDYVRIYQNSSADNKLTVY